MSALEEISKLHSRVNDIAYDCQHCHMRWPCPTRVLCDEAENRNEEFTVEVRNIVDDQLLRQRDEWEEDAERLAKAAWDFLNIADRNTTSANALRTALKMHDALREQRKS